MTGSNSVYTLLKRLASAMPLRYQQNLKRVHFARQIRRGRFHTDELEYAMLEQWVGAGDYVLDLGANIGHYTSKLSRLVGAAGRVIAFEPVPATFELLAANVARFPLQNVTLVNAAASDGAGVVGMHLPQFTTGLTNYYMAEITGDGGDLSVLSLAVDALGLGSAVTLAKIDVEGHELATLTGMAALLERDHPVLIVEGRSPEVAAYLARFGYGFEQLPESSNRVYSRHVD